MALSLLTSLASLEAPVIEEMLQWLKLVHDNIVLGSGLAGYVRLPIHRPDMAVTGRPSSLGKISAQQRSPSSTTIFSRFDYPR